MFSKDGNFFAITLYNSYRQKCWIGRIWRSDTSLRCNKCRLTSALFRFSDSSFWNGILVIFFKFMQPCYFCLYRFFQLDVLINNSGRSQKAEFQNIKLKVDKELFKTNVFGLLNLSRIVLPHFLAKSRGHIVITSSCAGKFGG